MNKKLILRLISSVMLTAAIVFVSIALTNPNLSRVMRIGSFEVGAEQWQICCTAYGVTMLYMFVASFFVNSFPQYEK